MDKYQSLLIMGWIQKNLVNCTDPRQHGKGLTVNRSGEWRYRIGDYRLIADINDETVTILMLEIGHRKIFTNKPFKLSASMFNKKDSTAFKR